MKLDKKLPRTRRMGLALAIGVFDGLHLGHREIIRVLKKKARQGQWPAAVLTFERHPLALLSPKREPPSLKGLDRKIELLREAGLDRAWVLKFNKTFASLTPESFIEQVLVKRLGVKALVVGADFRFGRGGKGDIQLLKTASQDLGFSLDVVKPAKLGKTTVSSTEIRKAVAAGNMRRAESLLGRPFRLYGKVVSGQGLGRKLKRPTANLDLEPTTLPKEGVWGGRARLKGGRGWKNFIANFGRRPTIEKKGKLKLELHFLADPGRVKGRRLEVELKHYLRAEKKFKDLDALKKQIAKDEMKFRNLLH